MVRKFLIALMAFVTVFFTNSQGWAAVNNAEKINEVYTVEKSNMFATQAPFEAVDSMGARNTNDMLWIASIFVGGLGQILMGDVPRGLKFLIIEAVVLAIPVVLWPILLSSGTLAFLGGAVGLVSSLLYLVFLAVHVWNIFDAYEMSKKTSGMSSIEADAKLAAELEKLMKISSSFESRNGNVSYKALAF